MDPTHIIADRATVYRETKTGRPKEEDIWVPRKGACMSVESARAAFDDGVVDMCTGRDETGNQVLFAKPRKIVDKYRMRMFGRSAQTISKP
jgi:hypothetical protein